MLPPASVSGLYFAHPQARYFSVGRVGGDHLDVDAEAGADRLHDLVGLLGEAPGVEGEHPHPRVDPAGEVEHDHALGLEAGHHREAAPERVDRPRQHLGGRAALQAGEVVLGRKRMGAVRPVGGGCRHGRAPLDALGSGP